MKINEENFVAQLKKRNEDALVYVMRTYGGLVKSVVTRHMQQYLIYEEDCINEVFFAVWEHIDSYISEKGSFANWIAGIARFKALDYVRKLSKQMREEHIEDMVTEIADVCEEEKASDYISEEIEEMILSLNETDRELFRRLYIEEQKISEMSAEMNMDSSVIYNRLSRSRKKLRKKYKMKNFFLN
ncbi:MAG: sigma-70 family RNA polymerase sigma factor [Lachnospiraceae bacterium]|nr:sigma-70 family RNA polymerase sigma factor [Lachnospiraceae bacterium]